jgi:hypothetical protein
MRVKPAKYLAWSMIGSVAATGMVTFNLCAAPLICKVSLVAVVLVAAQRTVVMVWVGTVLFGLCMA